MEFETKVNFSTDGTGTGSVHLQKLLQDEAKKFTTNPQYNVLENERRNASFSSRLVSQTTRLSCVGDCDILLCFGKFNAEGGNRGGEGGQSNVHSEHYDSSSSSLYSSLRLDDLLFGWWT